MTGGPLDTGLPDRDIQAAEYVIGTLPQVDRAAFARALATDADLRAAVLRWQTRLAPLAEMIPEVAPPAGLWLRIRAALGPAVDPRVETLARSLRRWRLAALGASALAAGLALTLGLERVLPPSDPEAGQYVAVVNRGGELPALVVRVDTRRGVAQVRPVAADTPRDKSLELWYIAGGGAPRSLGLVAAGRASMPIPDSTLGAANLDNAVLAVSVEPAGGSPSGSPTGPVVYSGKLLRE